MNDFAITLNMVQYAGAVVLMVGTLSAAIGAYVSHRAATNVNIDNIRERIESMADDIELKQDTTTCNVLSGRNREDIDQLKTTLYSTHDIVIRLETKVDSLLGEDDRG